MDFQRTALAICGVVTGYIWYKRHRAFPISDIPGPENPSWIHGHEWLWQIEDATVVEKSLLEEYGGIVRWNGTLGEERIWISDPKAIHHILHGTNYLYERSRVFVELAESVLGRGVFSAEEDAHKRLRKFMTPAFSLAQVKALYPYFSKGSNSLVDKWHEVILNTEPGQDAIVDVYSWFTKATLDVIGAGAFDYDFGALDNADNKFTKSYTNLTHGAFGRPSKWSTFVLDSFKWTPPGVPTWIYVRGKSPGIVNLRENKRYAHEVAAKLIEEKRQELENGTSQKDLLSLLVKENSSLRKDSRANDEEIIGQFRTILVAGHATLTRTLTALFWKLSENRHVQERLRAEIMQTLKKIRARGDSDFSVNDFDSMPYLLAVVKEILRVCPVVTELVRMPKQDDILPLSKPVVGYSGRVYKELPIPAGTSTTISTIGYHFAKDVWGPDADEFRPERWLDEKEKPESPVGVYGNLATFSGGAKGCIGWRFAVIELHTFLVTLVRQFDFSLPDDGRRVRNVRSPGNFTPVVAGEEDKGPQLWLKVTALSSE